MAVVAVPSVDGIYRGDNNTVESTVLSKDLIPGVEFMDLIFCCDSMDLLACLLPCIEEGRRGEDDEEEGGYEEDDEDG